MWSRMWATSTHGVALQEKVPRRIASMKRVVDVAVGDAHTIALMTCAKPKLPRTLPLKAFEHKLGD